MYAMNDEIRQNKKSKKTVIRSAKECAFIATFTAVLLLAQFALSFLPSVELVTVLFTAYAFATGARRGMLTATAFALLRQLLFGFFPSVLILYLIYYNLLALVFGWIGKRAKACVKNLPWQVAIACVCTACFTLLDNVITPLWYGFSAEATKAYFLGSLPFMFPQVFCTGIAQTFLFLPLVRALTTVRKQFLYKS